MICFVVAAPMVAVPFFTESLCHPVQWNLRIKDKLVHGPLSTIRGLSFIGEFLSKSLICVL